MGLLGPDTTWAESLQFEHVLLALSNSPKPMQRDRDTVTRDSGGSEQGLGPGLLPRGASSDADSHFNFLKNIHSPDWCQKEPITPESMPDFFFFFFSGDVFSGFEGGSLYWKHVVSV